GLHIRDVHVERRVRTTFGRLRDPAADTLATAVGVDHAVVRRVVGVDLPAEQLGVELVGSRFVLDADLEVNNWVTHRLLLFVRGSCCSYVDSSPGDLSQGSGPGSPSPTVTASRSK